MYQALETQHDKQLHNKCISWHFLSTKVCSLKDLQRSGFKCQPKIGSSTPKGIAFQLGEMNASQMQTDRYEKWKTKVMPFTNLCLCYHERGHHMDLPFVVTIFPVVLHPNPLKETFFLQLVPLTCRRKCNVK